MRLEKSKTFLCKDFYYTARVHSITHSFLVHVTIDRTADYRRTVWQVFCDLQTRRKQQYYCHNIFLLPDILIDINNVQFCKNQKYAVHDPGIYTHNFQALVGASLHAQSITGGWFVLFVQQRGVSGWLFFTALGDLATQKDATNTRRLCVRRGQRLRERKWFYRRPVIQHFVKFLNRPLFVTTVGLIGETIKRLYNT